MKNEKCKIGHWLLDVEMPSNSPSKFEWDAGTMGCGELILELKQRLGRLQPGESLRLIASDPGVPEDLPAWCRMTGNRLLRSAPPEFVIERKPT